MELPGIGANCSKIDCNRLDFLPFVCKACKRTFCDLHVSDHECASVSVNTKSPVEQLTSQVKSIIPVVSTCDEPGCKYTCPVAIKCESCGGHYCVTHRHIACPRIVSASPAVIDPAVLTAERFKEAKEAVDREVNLNIENAKRKPKNVAVANKVQLMRLKGKATGPKNIPQQDRVYFLVHVGRGQKSGPGIAVFVSSEWSIGRAIDVIASQCVVTNKNNVASAPKLHLFRTCDDNPLTKDMTEKIANLITNGIIANGDTLNIGYVN